MIATQPHPPGMLPNPTVERAPTEEASSRLRGYGMAHHSPRWSHTTWLDAAPISASLARAFVSHYLVEQLLLSLVDPVRLAVSELVTNALVHTKTPISVTLSASDTKVLLMVRDESLELPQRRIAQAVDETGRGLEIVDIVSLDWGINAGTGSKDVWASFAI